MLKQFILTHKEINPDFPLENSERHEDFTVVSEVNAKIVAYKEDLSSSNARVVDGRLTGPRRDSKLLKTVIVPGVNNYELGEIPVWKYIFSVLEPNEWATLNHYRRKAECPVAGVFGIARAIWLSSSVLDHTAYCHTSTMCKLLQKHLPTRDLEILKKREFIPYNIFCADKKTIGEWIAWQDYFIRKMVREDTGPDIVDFIKSDPDALKPRPGKNNSLDYQKRFYAFMSERLSTVFWLKRLSQFCQQRTKKYWDMKNRGEDFPLQENYSDGCIVDLNIRLLEDGQSI
jgi:hypothetical protein